MKIAVPYENGQIFQHFGHTTRFKIYLVENGEIRNSVFVEPEGSGHGALAGILHGLGVDTVLCGGIGAGARTALEKAGIRLYPGVHGDADESIAALLAGRLVVDLQATCHEHDHEHGHDCGDGCGHDCGHTC